MRIHGQTDDRSGYRAPPPEQPGALFDEYIAGYRDRSAIVAQDDVGALWPRGNAVSCVVVLDGRIVGTRRRRLEPKRLIVEPQFFAPPTSATKRAVATAARRYAAFLDLPLELGAMSERGS